MTHQIGIIGLGTMGQRMLMMLIRDERFSVVAVTDKNLAQTQTFLEPYPDVQIMSDPVALISRDDIDLVYIATPPISHIEYANLAIDHHKPILCEKPLATNIDEANKLVLRVQDSGLPNAINFPGASSPVIEIIENAIESGELGKPLSVEIRCHFSQWPRKWQQGASSWLSGRDEGGFVREVVSHFIYQTQRLLGDMEVMSSTVDYPDRNTSETYVMASLRYGEIPVKLFGGVGGVSPDLVEWVLYGTKKSYRLLNWRQLQEATDDEWLDVDMGQSPTQSPHLTAISNMLTGKPHPLADFAMGLDVQRTIETILTM